MKKSLLSCCFFTCLAFFSLTSFSQFIMTRSFYGWKKYAEIRTFWFFCRWYRNFYVKVLVLRSFFHSLFRQFSGFDWTVGQKKVKKKTILLGVNFDYFSIIFLNKHLLNLIEAKKTLNRAITQALAEDQFAQKVAYKETGRELLVVLIMQMKCLNIVSLKKYQF